MPEPAVLVVADDLSGAADSAAALAGRAETVVLLDRDAPLPAAADAVAGDTDRRYAAPAEAAARAAAAIRRSGAGTLVYKTIDSTLRGNIGPEIRGFAGTCASGQRTFSNLTFCLRHFSRSAPDERRHRWL